MANILGFIVTKWRWFAGGAAGLLLFICLVAGVRSCLTPTPTLNAAEVQRAEQALKDRNDEALREILVDSDVRLRDIDSNIKAAEEATERAKRTYANMNTEELAAELERRK